MNSESIPAHLHHAWEIYNMHGRTTQALRSAIFSARKEESPKTVKRIYAEFA